MAWVQSGGLAWAAPGELVVTPAGNLVSSGFARGPFTVLEQVYTLTNMGAADIPWSANKNRPWISLSPMTGTLAPGGLAEVRVRMNSLALDLAVGEQVATINFINQNTFEITSRSVNLSVQLPGAGTATVESVTTSGQYAITLTGEPGTTYVLEQSDGVAGSYEPLTTNEFAGATASVEISSLGVSSRFYRAVSSGSGAVASTLAIALVESEDDTVVRVVGDPNGVYLVEGTTNMTDWVAVSTNKMPASGEVIITNVVLVTDEAITYRAVPAGALTVPTVSHVLILGEAMARGLDGAPPLSTEPSQVHYRFRFDGTLSFLTPLAEVGLETIASGAANEISSLAPSTRVVMSNVSQQGALYEQQKKGTVIYDFGLAQFREAPQVIACELKTYVPAALFVVAGEGDQINTSYQTNIRDWQADYEKDIQFLSGATGRIPMFHSQISAWTSTFAGSRSTAESPYQVLAEAEASPTRTVLVGPRYFLTYSGEGAQFPGLLLNNEGYRWLGEYYGKVYKRVVVDGAAWSPLKPNTVTRSGAVITAVFDVPVPPLVLDTTWVTDPGDFGFEYTDSSASPPAIASVSLLGDNSVQVTLESVPTGGNQRLRYAYHGIPGNPGGPTSGPRGNLRDSDATPSLHGNTLYNWCVHFDKPIN